MDTDRENKGHIYFVMYLSVDFPAFEKLLRGKEPSHQDARVEKAGGQQAQSGKTESRDCRARLGLHSIGAIS